ncbi:MAG: methyltransferase [Acetobacteraceae bacterium]|nr:methyltransferase [Acetobacteraceae bacterium]
MRTTEGHLLGGRLRYAQPADGYRTGIEPVLLAAATPARPGQRVLEAGTGAGAGLMCLAARVPGVTGVGVELDPDMTELARRNIAANRIGGLEVVLGDVTRMELAGFDHACANPPWHDPRSTASPVARRRLAKQAAGGLGAWVAALAGALRPGGTVTLILPSHSLAKAEAALAQSAMQPARTIRLLPKAGRSPKLILLTGLHGPATPPQTASIVLHQEDGAYTPEIEAVLRDGTALLVPDPRQ